MARRERSGYGTIDQGNMYNSISSHQQINRGMIFITLSMCCCFAVSGALMFGGLAKIGQLGPDSGVPSNSSIPSNTTVPTNGTAPSNHGAGFLDPQNVAMYPFIAGMIAMATISIYCICKHDEKAPSLPAMARSTLPSRLPSCIVFSRSQKGSVEDGDRGAIQMTPSREAREQAAQSSEKDGLLRIETNF